jgi:hypothetical protein
MAADKAPEGKPHAEEIHTPQTMRGPAKVTPHSIPITIPAMDAVQPIWIGAGVTDLRRGLAGLRGSTQTALVRWPWPKRRYRTTIILYAADFE